MKPSPESAHRAPGPCSSMPRALMSCVRRHRPSPRRRSFLTSAALALAITGIVIAAAPGSTHAAFPDRPVKVVVGFGPGTGSDLQARAIADVLARQLGQPVVVENRPGAAGMTATASVAGAPADGYTVVFGTTTLIVTLPLMSRHAKYDGLRDFAPIGTMGKAAFVVVVAARDGAPAGLRELLGEVKRGDTTFGSLGNGSFGHLGTLRLLREAGGLSATHVPYKSSAQELQDLVSGQLSFVVDSTTATLPLLRGGKLKALAVTSRTRLAALPEVPTVAELLGSDFEHAVWTGLLAPTGTPDSVLQRWSSALRATLESAEVRQRYDAMQLMPFTLDAHGFAQHLQAEVPAWQAFLRETGIRIEE